MRTMILFAPTAEKNSQLTAMTIGFTAHENAMRMQGGKMDNYQNIIMYKLAMHLAEDMKNRGIITDEEYVTIEQKMCEKFSINSTSIYRKMT